MFRTLTPWAARSARPLGKFEMELPAWIDRMFGPEDEWWTNGENFVPRIDVMETPQAMEISVELPGMKPEDVKVEVLEGRLLISGEKKEEHEVHDKTFHRVERRYGEFRRVVPLAASIDAEKITADYKEGVLHVNVPKIPAAQPKAITVTS